MKKKTYKVLEFDKIINMLASYTESEKVKERIMHLEPFDNLQDAKNAQTETSEALSIILRMGDPGINLGVFDITGCIKRVESNGLLNLTEFIHINRVLNVSRRMKNYLLGTNPTDWILPGLEKELESCKPLEEEIASVVLSDTQVNDNASPELASIRRKKASKNAKIKDILNDMVRSSKYKKILQDAIVTIRRDRYVLPVRSEYRNEVPGIVHDSSQSGGTLFIEPISVVNLNNEIKELENKEEQEIERILYELSEKVAEKSQVILNDYNIISRLDFIFCKAKLSIDMDANEPELNDDDIIHLTKARHPLIDKDKVVANDIILGEEFDTLVITGPNTGGKTVTLKTVGLFSLMAASGLHLPVSLPSKCAVFKNVFADIGDEQSIEQSLSTFSSHMVTIVKIIKEVSDKTLVLFDELGAGTDPTEGAALAVSILERLRMLGAKTIATTHYSELKLFALTTQGVENASCEFDVESLKPTYKLMIGVPGKSNAFAISRRLGLEDEIINRANVLLSDEEVKFEDVITELEQNRVKAQNEKQTYERMKNEITALGQKVEKERQKLKENKERILSQAYREAKVLVMEAKEEANRVIRDLEKMKQKALKNADFNDTITKTRQTFKNREEKIDKVINRQDSKKKIYRKLPEDLKMGQTVKIISIGETATVLKSQQKGDETIRVQAGIIKMDVSLSDIEVVADNNSKQVYQKYVPKKGYVSKTSSVSTEVDVRGQDLIEAIMNVEKFIDNSYLAGISPVSVIHGKGTGVLRKGIGEMLSKNKYVKSYRLGRYGEGETGVTIVEIKL